ncbi:MAG: FAD-dependent oxidoreductase [Nocardioidaceae bacterium]
MSPAVSTTGPEQVWDLVVVGGGTAGIVAAKTAAGLGATVLLVERDRTGGDCLWTGCVPSKTLLAAAHTAAAARRAPELGVDTGPVTVAFDRVMAQVRAAVAAIEPEDSPAAMRAAGVAVRHGSARFTGARSLDVDGEPVSFVRAVLATGARPAVPPVPGLADAQPLTSDTVWDLDVLPARLLVIGGGTIGCELGQALARLGSQVTIVEAAGRVLPAEEAEASALVLDSLHRDGVEVLLGSPVHQVVAPTDGQAGRVRLEDGRGARFDQVLVAVGRSPRTEDLGLASAGIDVDDRGQVRVDAALRTTNPRVWAAGDLTGHPRFTHVAGVHGSLAAGNAVLGVRRHVGGAVPRVTFTDPEVAAVGVAPSAAAANPRLRVVTVDHEHLDRAVTEGRTQGYLRLVLDSRRRLVGAVAVGPRAGEVLGEATLAVSRGLRTRQVAGVTHAYPTFCDALWNAAVADVRESLQRPAVAALTRALVRVRRHRLAGGGVQ